MYLWQKKHVKKISVTSLFYILSMIKGYYDNL